MCSTLRLEAGKSYSEGSNSNLTLRMLDARPLPAR